MTITNTFRFILIPFAWLTKKKKKLQKVIIKNQKFEIKKIIEINAILMIEYMDCIICFFCSFTLRKCWRVKLPLQHNPSIHPFPSFIHPSIYPVLFHMYVKRESNFTFQYVVSSLSMGLLKLFVTVAFYSQVQNKRRCLSFTGGDTFYTLFASFILF